MGWPLIARFALTKTGARASRGLGGTFGVAAKNPIKATLLATSADVGLNNGNLTVKPAVTAIKNEIVNRLGLDNFGGFSGMKDMFNSLSAGIDKIAPSYGKAIAGILTLATGGLLASSLLSGNLMSLAIIVGTGALAYTMLSDKKGLPIIASAGPTSKPL